MAHGSPRCTGEQQGGCRRRDLGVEVGLEVDEEAPRERYLANLVRLGRTERAHAADLGKALGDDQLASENVDVPAAQGEALTHAQSSVGEQFHDQGEGRIRSYGLATTAVRPPRCDAVAQVRGEKFYLVNREDGRVVFGQAREPMMLAARIRLDQPFADRGIHR